MRTTMAQTVLMAASLLPVAFSNSAVTFRLALNLLIGMAAVTLMKEVLRSGNRRCAAESAVAAGGR